MHSCFTNACCFQINFEKKEERWWDAVLVTEPKISVRKIDASRPITDLDEEAQAKIEEMMYNDRQKKMGLPTSKEQVSFSSGIIVVLATLS